MSTALVAVLAALVAAGGAYLGIARRLSGKIATSEASNLWAESAAIREQFRQENERLRQRIEVLEKRTDDLGGDNQQLREQNSLLESRIDLLEAENARLHLENDALKNRVDQLIAARDDA